MIKLAMIELLREIQSKNLAANMLLQIHDELILEVSPEALTEVQALVPHVMTRVMPLRVPLQVDVKVGDNWASCEPVDDQ